MNLRRKTSANYALSGPPLRPNHLPLHHSSTRFEVHGRVPANSTHAVGLAVKTSCSRTFRGCRSAPPDPWPRQRPCVEPDPVVDVLGVSGHEGALPRHPAVDGIEDSQPRVAADPALVRWVGNVHGAIIICPPPDCAWKRPELVILPLQVGISIRPCRAGYRVDVRPWHGLLRQQERPQAQQDNGKTWKQLHCFTLSATIPSPLGIRLVVGHCPPVCG